MLRRRVRQDRPGPPRRDRWQRLLDALLGVSGRVSAPLAGRAERLWLEALSRPELSHVVGHIAALRLPRPLLVRLIRAYVRLYDVDLRDVARELTEFETFDAFFVRRLRAGARPIDGRPGVLVCPADARLDRLGKIEPGGGIPEIKGHTLAVADLLGAGADPARYSEGSYAVLYLSPRDYHRVHSPAAGVVRSVTPIAGRRYPVNRLATRSIPSLFAINARVVFELETDRLGRVALVMVGATNVSRISVAPRRGATVARGDELGAFHLGSTVVLLTERADLAPSGGLEGEMLQVGRALFELPEG